jgi:hypothetical protein
MYSIESRYKLEFSSKIFGLPIKSARGNYHEQKFEPYRRLQLCALDQVVTHGHQVSPRSHSNADEDGCSYSLELQKALPIGRLQHLVIQINRMCNTCRKVSLSVVSGPLTRCMDLDEMTPIDFKSCRKEAQKRLGTRAQKANYERSADTETYIDSRYTTARSLKVSR